MDTRPAERQRLLNRRQFCLSALGAAALGTVAFASANDGKMEKAPNIVFIVLDTVRANHVGCWGYKRPTTRFLDSFAKNATCYRRAYSTSPWTLPAHVTMFTGLYSYQHGIEGSLQTGKDGKEHVVVPPVPDSVELLAETLGDLGYSTGAFTANSAFMSLPWNIDQGFETYEVHRIPGLDLLKQIPPWIKARDQRPFFLFVNLMDAHYPYNTRPCPGLAWEPAPRDPDLIKRLINNVLPAKEPVDAQLVRDVTLQYDQGIANADYATAQLVEHLKQQGLYDNSLIIVTSDHGEFLGEHLLVQHSKDLYEEVLHVPLLVKAPGQQAGLWKDSPVSLVQLYGEVLRAASKEGVSAPDLSMPAELIAEINYSRNWDIQSPGWSHRFKRLRTAYYDFPWKLIHSSDNAHELYNVQDDPGEANNLFGASRDVADRLMKRLELLKPLSQAPAPQAPQVPELSEENIEALKANGYL